MNGRFLGRLGGWLPLLGLVALALLSIEMLGSSFRRWDVAMEQSTVALDNLAESRLRLMRAYLIEQRRAGGDAAFDASMAPAQVQAAEDALEDWMRGRSAILPLGAGKPADASLLPLARRYRATLTDFRRALGQPDDPIRLRNAFARAEGAADALERALHSRLGATIAAERTGFWLRISAWTLLLVAAGVAAAYARAARRGAEAERAESESRLSRLRAAAPVGIVECDGTGAVVAANLAWCDMTGLGEAAWQGRSWWLAVAEPDRERARELWRAGADGPARETELRLDAGEDEIGSRWMVVRVARNVAAMGAGEAVPRCIATFTDVTERRRVEEQLQHAQRMEAVGRLAGGVAHDFNNLLTGIGGFATLALDELPADHPVRPDVQEVLASVGRGTALTRQLLAFSRQERIEPVVLDVNEVVAELESLLRRLVREDIALELSLAEESRVLADPGQIEQVVTNLVVNAADAIDGAGRIRVGVRNVTVTEPFEGATSRVQPGDYAVLSVSDTGAGIPPEIRARIFEPFYTTKESGRGTGLGLSTVWGIVRQGGGHVHVYSEPERGTVFRVYLPLTGAQRDEEAASESQSGAGSHPGGTALLVEDEEAVRRMASRVLELNGWAVLEASSGTEALDILQRHDAPVDLVITDVVMRGIGGIELAERLRRDDGGAPAILFVSGYVDGDLPLEGEHFLEKPFSPRALLAAVDRALA